jgi:hypothetical protein
VPCQHPAGEEEPTMGDQTPAPANRDDHEADAPDEASEAAMMRAVMRGQEKHREGGVDPELSDEDAEPGPGA